METLKRVNNKKQYDKVMALIEEYIVKATNGGGFRCLSKEEANELDSLTKMINRYDDLKKPT